MNRNSSISTNNGSAAVRGMRVWKQKSAARWHIDIDLDFFFGVLMWFVILVAHQKAVAAAHPKITTDVEFANW